jgi:hypothetical protein
MAHSLFSPLDVRFMEVACIDSFFVDKGVSLWSCRLAVSCWIVPLFIEDGLELVSQVYRASVLFAPVGPKKKEDAGVPKKGILNGTIRLYVAIAHHDVSKG